MTTGVVGAVSAQHMLQFVECSTAAVMSKFTLFSNLEVDIALS